MILTEQMSAVKARELTSTPQLAPRLGFPQLGWWLVASVLFQQQKFVLLRQQTDIL